MLRPASDLVSDFAVGCALAARSVAALCFPSVTLEPGPGWKGCNPLGVSTVTRKWPVNGGPMFEGRSWGSTYAMLVADQTTLHQ